MANKAINELLKYGTRPWVNPKMTSMILPKGVVTNAPTARLHAGNPWAMFSNGSDYVVYYRGYGGVEAPYTHYTLATGELCLLKQILPMLGSGDYIKGTQCACDLYLNGSVVANLGTVTFASGLTLSTPVLFNGIRFKNFVGGGHPDLVGWNAFPLVGYQL